ncbi:MAG: hypothetical protein H6791_01055 [Candidatus Nomurabacteria bacterium]|nr:MAG: hypothetical protein H6791_01055 [Candidatus Nomurabacteria bacterium]
MSVISFKPKQVTKKIISPLKNRSYDVIVARYGLEDGDRRTLESIGQKYGITRERVRQIENAAINSIRKSGEMKEFDGIFEELHRIVKDMGLVVAEEDLLNHISKDPVVQNHIHFYLVLEDRFHKFKEDDHLRSRWTIDKGLSEKIHTALKGLYASLDDAELLTENDVVKRFIESLQDIREEYKKEEIAKRWLTLSKKVKANPLGEWGKSDSSGIKVRGIKDYAYLTMRKNGSPMHFTEVAKAIQKDFGKKCHTATCHNELIKDDRFVLIGRGMYSISDWGYKPGIVREVIKEILVKEGPMTKEEVVEKVLKERYLKRNTILVNLQNSKYFKKDKNGLYHAI